jgi:hypothetical protein
MTKQEFEKLTGIQVTDAEFTWADNCYLLTDNVTKQEFAKQYVRLNLHKLIKAVVQMEFDLECKTKECTGHQAKLQLIQSIL